MSYEQKFVKALPPLQRKRKTVLARDVFATVMSNAYLDDQIAVLKEDRPALTFVTVGELRRRGRRKRSYCVCNAGEEPNSVWIGCDMCDEWFHPPCVGLGDMTKSQVEAYPRWTCDECRALDAPAADSGSESGSEGGSDSGGNDDSQGESE